jgi:putative ABC transport system permease protein
MSLLEALAVALRALRVNALRSALTMLAVVVGVAAVVAVVAIGSGANARIAEQIRSLGSNLLLVQPGAASQGAVRLAVGSRQNLTEADAQAIASQVSGVQLAAPTVAGNGQLVHGNRNWSTLSGGIAPDYLIARDWALARGRPFTLDETERAAKVVLLGATTAAKLFEQEDPLGQLVRIGNVPFTVVGVLGEKGQNASGRDQDDVALIPLAAGKLRVLGGRSAAHREAVDFILVKVAEVGAMAAVQAQVRELLRQRHRLAAAAGDDFRLSDPAAAMTVEAEATRSLALLLAAIAAVALVVGGIGITNVMLVAVTERTREIGVRLAVGARPRDIRRQFLTEAVTLSACGGLAGVVLGVGAAILIARVLGWAILLSPAMLLLAFAIAAAIGIFFGFYPALKASRLDPVEALRFE